MGKQLVIDNVDFDLLDEQRGALHRAIDSLAYGGEERELLEGLEAMLDEWSDKRYYEEKATNCAACDRILQQLSFEGKRVSLGLQCRYCKKIMCSDCLHDLEGTRLCNVCAEKVMNVPLPPLPKEDNNDCT